MNDRDPRPSDPVDPPIADAGALFKDAPGPNPSPRTPPPRGASPGDHYDLGDLPDTPARRPVPPLPLDQPPDKPPGPRKVARSEATQTATPRRPEPEATVDQVWSRGAEWGKTLALIVAALVGMLWLVYLLLSNEHFSLAFLTLMISAVVLLFLSYPILITLERPVRVTPEQAVRDYFTALSHHLPHYRRMWLLLSSAGRISSSFGSFEGFRGYWNERLAGLRSGRAGRYTPLKFQVDDFRAEKSAGLSRIDATYTVNVFVRGRQAEGPVESVKVSTTLVKGPDRMWYLNRGTLP